MQTFQVLHLLVLILLAITLTESQYISKPGCSYRCGNVAVEYPFGIGKNCSANKWYTVDCNASTPYLSALNNAEVLYIGDDTVIVNMSVIKADCKNPVKNSSLVLSTSHGKSPFLISRSSNIVRYNGCGHVAIMDGGVVVSGCSTTCGEDAVSDFDMCLGNGCCQITIPDYLQSFTINLTELEGQDGCGSASLVDAAEYSRTFPIQSTVGDHTFVPISLSWNESFSTTLLDEHETCGDVGIPYPFGIRKNASRVEWFNVDCNSSTPYLPALNNVEVLAINASQQTVTVNVFRISDCENTVQNISLFLSKTHLWFSKFDNIFVFEGCGSAVLLAENDIITGCSTTCGNETVSDTQNCFGIGCCKAPIPDSYGQFTFKRKDMERQAGDRNCGSAFLIDKNSFIERRFSRQFVPVTLYWDEEFGFDNKECVICREIGGYCYPKADRQPGIVCRNDIPSVKKSYNRGVILGVSISMGSLFLIGIGYALYKLIKKTKVRRRKQKCFKRNGGLLLKQQEAGDISLVDKTILFTSNELEKATDHFNENRILGRGGQGTVYKGMLADGRIVAIKKSKVVDESQLEQFINEVVILSQVNHRNVVKLLGCCLETEVPLLVSEFISNGTLYDHIHDETGEFSISLNMRLQIATEVAGAVSYLHSATSIPIYHRDIKTTNILLDEKYRAKVSDFGTSRFVSVDQTHLTTLVQGTFGYLDPEYFQSSQITEKSDVYSFGVVLLELLTREKPISLTRFGVNRSLATHFLSAMEEGRVMSIFDAMVVKEGARAELLALANLAMRCLSFNGKNRPTMKEVTTELEGIRLAYVPSTVETSFAQIKHCDEVALTYGESTSTSITFDHNPSQ